MGEAKRRRRRRNGGLTTTVDASREARFETPRTGGVGSVGDKGQARDSGDAAEAPTSAPKWQPVPTYSQDGRPMRDSLTGAPLVKSTLAAPVVSRPMRPAIPDDRPYPQRMDSTRPFNEGQGGVPTQRRQGEKRPASEDYLGGFEWSSDFRRYIAPVLPTSVAEAKRLWRQWWELPVIIERLYVHLGKEKADTALMAWRDRMHPADIAEAVHHSPNWVVRQKARAARLVRSKYLPYSILRNWPEFTAYAESFTLTKAEREALEATPEQAQAQAS